jgi:hypothetical protein
MTNSVVMPGHVKCVVDLSFPLAIGSHPTFAQTISLIWNLDEMETCLYFRFFKFLEYGEILLLVNGNYLQWKQVINKGLSA